MINIKNTRLGFFGKKNSAIFLSLMACAITANAGQATVSGATIQKIRAVGEFAAPAYSNTLEISFVTPLVFALAVKCVVTTRVYVDAKNKHVISAAYLAMALGKKVNVNVDDSLPMRDGACEISFLDVEQ